VNFLLEWPTDYSAFCRWSNPLHPISGGQAEAIKMTRIGEKSQAEIAELFNVDRSTISRMMKEVREKELVKAVR
jgi:DNA-binding MarR family transcriptional regulator